MHSQNVLTKLKFLDAMFVLFQKLATHAVITKITNITGPEPNLIELGGGKILELENLELTFNSVPVKIALMCEDNDTTGYLHVKMDDKYIRAYNDYGLVSEELLMLLLGTNDDRQIH